MIWQPSNSIKVFIKKQSLSIIIDVDRWCPGLSVEQDVAAVARFALATASGSAAQLHALLPTVERFVESALVLPLVALDDPVAQAYEHLIQLMLFVKVELISEIA